MTGPAAQPGAGSAGLSGTASRRQPASGTAEEPGDGPAAQPQDGSPGATRPVCVLVGPPGAGKTTVGQALAEALGVTFRDTDADIVAATGKEITEIFVDDGEDVFRALERRAVADALGTHPGVLALGGGAVLAEETRALLMAHVVVYLELDLSTAVSRVGLQGGRPLLMSNPRATLRFLLDQRRPLYEEVADVIVPAAVPPAEVVAMISSALKELSAL